MDKMEDLRRLLARAHGICIQNSERNSESTGAPCCERIDISKTSSSGLRHELKLDLPGFMDDFVPAGQVLDRCREIFTGQVGRPEAESLYSILVEIMARHVAENCREDFRERHCLGCQFVDSCGMKGHASQRRHECLTWSALDRLDASFTKCFKNLQKAVVIDKFLDSLSSDLLRPDDREFYEYVVAEITPRKNSMTEMSHRFQ